MNFGAATANSPGGFWNRCRRAAAYAASDGIPARSVKVAMVVGSLLNIINQGDAVLTAHAINWLKLMLTFLVPYGVSTYAAVAYKLSRAASGDPALRSDDPPQTG
jgi:hypothetical protein